VLLFLGISLPSIRLAPNTRRLVGPSTSGAGASVYRPAQYGSNVPGVRETDNEYPTGVDLVGQPGTTEQGLGPEYLLRRRRESEERLRLVIEALRNLGSNYDLRRVCIYATGSYGRGESATTSDLDLFMVDTAFGEAQIGNRAQTLLKADIINHCEQLELPDGGHLPQFSRDGYFLVVHKLEEIDRALGGQQDDAANFFTARLLLLLESKCLYNEDAYERTITRVLKTYFRDATMRTDFLPAFLINDIARFWKTLCLNYEHARGTQFEEIMQDPILAREYKLKNLKLKFNRVMTCYSALACLVQYDRAGQVTPTNVHNMILLSPTDRLEWLARENPAVRTEVATVLKEYAWWLEKTEGGEEPTLQWLRDVASQQDAKEAARRYGEAFYALLLEVGRQGRALRYITM
jgi:hypothetical protein